MPSHSARGSRLALIALAAMTLAGCGVFYGYGGGDPDGPADLGPTTSRDLAWTGGDTLGLSVPGKLTYLQGPPSQLLHITGPQAELDNIEVVGGEIRFKTRMPRTKGVTMTLTEPDIDHFKLSGAGSIDIQNYGHPALTIDLSGVGSIKAAGQTDKLNLVLSGVGSADLTALTLKDATVRASGVGSATLAPTGAADVALSGVGSVKLLTRPAQLTKHVSGVGSVSVP